MKKKIKLDAMEKAILDSYNKGEWESIDPSPKLLRKYKLAAQASLAKNKRINIRLSARVLEDFQYKAVQEGLPYQTLIASVLYKFITGRLVEQGKSRKL